MKLNCLQYFKFLLRPKLFDLRDYRSINSKALELKVYNSLTKDKETLQLKDKNVLYWYSCGPTVYDSAHLGHAR